MNSIHQMISITWLTLSGLKILGCLASGLCSLSSSSSPFSFSNGRFLSLTGVSNVSLGVSTAGVISLSSTVLSSFVGGAISMSTGFSSGTTLSTSMLLPLSSSLGGATTTSFSCSLDAAGAAATCSSSGNLGASWTTAGTDSVAADGLASSSSAAPLIPFVSTSSGAFTDDSICFPAAGFSSSSVSEMPESAVAIKCY